MYFLIISILILFFLPYLLLNKSERLRAYGRLKQKKYLAFNGRRYYAELREFHDYKQALHNYFKIVSEFSEMAPILESKQDYYDWSNTILRFNSSTINLIRIVDLVLFIESEGPVSIGDMDDDSVLIVKSIKT